MRDVSGKQKFSGAWDEHLKNCLNIYETLSTMRKATPTEKLKTIPIMLTWDVLKYYKNNVNRWRTYKASVSKLREWCKSDDKKSRILKKWQSSFWKKQMAEDSSEHKVTVCRKFVTKFISIQIQQDVGYHTDRFLRSILLTTVKISSIQRTSREHKPRTAQNCKKPSREPDQWQSQPHKKYSSIPECTIKEEEEDVLYYLFK